MKVMFIDVNKTIVVDRPFMGKLFSDLGHVPVGTYPADGPFPQLVGLPKFKTLHGPFMHYSDARYETPKAFDMLSN